MRTLIIVLGLAVSSLTTADTRAPTDDEIDRKSTRLNSSH